MRKTNTTITTMLLLIIIAGSIIPVYAAGSIVSKEFITGAPLSQWGIGDGLYKMTYSDGSSEYQIIKGNLLSIVSMTPEVQNINVGQYGATITYTVKADVSPTIAGSSTLNYRYKLYQDSCTSGADVGTGGNFYMVYGETQQATFPGKSAFTAVGEYKYCLRETVEIVSVSPPVWARGNDFYIKVIVTDPNAPAATTTATATATATASASATATATATATASASATATAAPTGSGTPAKPVIKIIPTTPGFEGIYLIAGLLLLTVYKKKQEQ